jgi:hypothetical protein
MAMNMLRLFLILAWLAVAYVTVQAVSSEGMIAGDVFFADIKTLSWRAQFNVDFLVHLLLFGGWVSWRHQFSPTGVVLGVLCVLGGALVSFLYLLVAGMAVKGDGKKLMLGNHTH